MFGSVRLAGLWPGPLILTAGWYRASARPWNDDRPEAALRLERGAFRFLAACVEALHNRGVEGIASPPLYRPGIWAKAGFEPWLALDLYERRLADGFPDPKVRIVVGDKTGAWQRAIEIDRAAFAPLWRLGKIGLEESLVSTPTTVFLVDEELRGFAIVAYAVGTAYLQRLAVDPLHQSEGVGSSLVTAALRWAAHHGGRTMLLNTQPDNEASVRLYQRFGFQRNPDRLTVFRREISH